MVFPNPYNLRGVTMGNAMSYAPYAFPIAQGARSMMGGGSKFASRGSTQTLVNSRRRKRFKKNSFNHKLMSAQPAKHYCNSSDTPLTQSTVFSVSPTQGIVQGDSNSQREGDYIHLAAMKIKGIFNAPSTSTGAFSYRILVGYQTTESSAPSTLVNSALGVNDLFITNSSANWAINGIINPKAFTVLYDETVDINSLVTATADLQSYSFTVPLDKKFPYKFDANQYGKYTNLWIVVIGSTIGGVAGTTVVGSTKMSYDLIFKPL